MTTAKREGFTLVELLVACTVSLVVLGVVFGFYSRYRARARDEKRKQDLHWLADALELYYSDYGLYPNTGTLRSSVEARWLTGVLYTALDNYITRKNLPIDPLNNTGGTSGYRYWYQDCTTSGANCDNCMALESKRICGVISGCSGAGSARRLYFLAAKLEAQSGYYCLGTPVSSCNTFINWGGCVNRDDMSPP